MILAAGCFDGLSAPQVRYLQFAKRINPQQSLVVTLETDAYIREVKGREPCWPLADRAYAVSGLACVDHVHTQGEDERVPDVIRLLQPAYFVKGPDWTTSLDDAHRDACAEVGAEIVFTRNFGKHWSDVRCSR